MDAASLDLTSMSLNRSSPTLDAAPSQSADVTDMPTPPHSSTEDVDHTVPAAAKAAKKKKRKPKKSAAAKARDLEAAKNAAKAARPQVLCISRNKHWKYISSYHGPWLQLPIELLESLLVLNMDPTTLTPDFTRVQPPSSSASKRDRAYLSITDHNTNLTPPDSPNALPHTQLFPIPKPGQPTPPPIDPGVFRGVTAVRQLVEEAAELSVRASSGLSAAASSGLNNNNWGGGNQFQMGGGNGAGGGERVISMSPMRAHRLRALAVQKLAQAYKADEIASSVLVMQSSGSLFDDIAERVLKFDPTNVDARYVHFFHEKIPSRQLAESTNTDVLDELILAQPQRLEFFRTRGIVHCFREDFTLAARDFTHAIKEARAVRKAKSAHSSFAADARTKSQKKKKNGNKSNGQMPDSDSVLEDSSTTATMLLHPSVLPDAPDAIEPQLLFHRGSAYLQQAMFLIETTVLGTENVPRVPPTDGSDLRLSNLENSRYGGVEVFSDTPLGKSGSLKELAYREALTSDGLREQVLSLVKKSMRDHEKFISHFDSLESPNSVFQGDLAQSTEYAFSLCESVLPGPATQRNTNLLLPDGPAMFTTYHPLLVEAHFTVLIGHLMLGDFKSLLSAFARTASVVDGLEGYPVFLPPRSMAQAEFMEVLDRLAKGWKQGIQPHSLSRCYSKRLAIGPSAPPTPSRSPSPPLRGHSFISGGGSSSRLRDASSSSSSSSLGCSSSALPTPAAASPAPELIEALDYARILLAPVVARQQQRQHAAKTNSNSRKSSSGGGGGGSTTNNIHIPLHGPRVDVILAWLGALHLSDLETATVVLRTQ